MFISKKELCKLRLAIHNLRYSTIVDLASDLREVKASVAKLECQHKQNNVIIEWPDVIYTCKRCGRKCYIPWDSFSIDEQNSLVRLGIAPRDWPLNGTKVRKAGK